MARNKLAGTKVGNSKSAKYYQDNPEAKKKKDTPPFDRASCCPRLPDDVLCELVKI